MVFDGTTLKSYLNGILDGSTSASGSLRTTDGSLRIGAYAPLKGTTSKSFFTGLIDEVAVFDRALSVAEIQSYYLGSLRGQPVITAQSPSMTNTPGFPVSLGVTASGINPIAYQWFFNTTNRLAGATNSTVTLSNVTPANSGNYSVVLSNGLGSLTSGVTVLTVTSGPPTIIAQPESQAAVISGAVRFAVLAAGPDPLMYQWRKEGADIVGATRSRYTLPRAQTNHAGAYTVVVSNPSGSLTSSIAFLTVSPVAQATLVAPKISLNWRLYAVCGLIVSLVAVSLQQLRLQRARRIKQRENEESLTRQRRELARNIHDGLGSRLTLLSLWSQQPKDSSSSQMPAQALAEETARMVDQLIWTIKPENDDLAHLAEYLGQMATEFAGAAGIAVRLDWPEHIPAWPLSAGERHEIVFAATEAINNAVKYARCQTVWLRLTLGGESFRLIIEDDGCGFSASDRRAGGNGLPNIESRMSEIGGRAVLESAPGQGPRVILEGPRPAAKRQPA